MAKATGIKRVAQMAAGYKPSKKVAAASGAVGAVAVRKIYSHPEIGQQLAQHPVYGPIQRAMGIKPKVETKPMSRTENKHPNVRGY